MIIEEKFHIPGRGHILLPKKLPENPGQYIGTTIDHEDTLYEVTSYEAMRCLVHNCNCLRSVAFVCKKKEQ